jgi:hypothetical protein
MRIGFTSSSNVILPLGYGITYKFHGRNKDTAVCR